MDRSSFTTSASSCASAPQASSSLPETDGQSNEGDGSSQSRHSSPVSDSPPNDSGPTAKHANKLEALIKNKVLRADPAVADLFYQAVKDELEYSTPEYTEKVEGGHEFSLLDLLELEAFDLVQHSRAVTECAASSAEPSSASSPTQHGTPASASGQSQSKARISSFLTECFIVTLLSFSASSSQALYKRKLSYLVHPYICGNTEC
jgi:hypothetical protein